MKCEYCKSKEATKKIEKYNVCDICFKDLTPPSWLSEKNKKEFIKKIKWK